MCFFLVWCCNSSFVLASDVYDIKKIDLLILQAEKEYDIPPGLLAAIAKIESGHHAFAINVGGKAIYPKTLLEAIDLVQEQVKQGTTNIDLGVMQLNYRWHFDNFDSINEMLNPKQNITYAAKLLKSLYKRHKNWQKAVQYYHSSKDKYNSKYSRKVVMCWLGI